MRYGLVVMILVLLSHIAAAWPAHGNDTASLRASFEKEIAALNARELDVLMGNQHAQIIALSPSSPSAIDGKADRRKGYQGLFEAMESFTLIPDNPRYRVAGDTGIVWGMYKIESHPKEGSPATFSVRFSRTYTYAGGQWELLLYHVSPLPQQRVQD